MARAKSQFENTGSSAPADAEVVSDDAAEEVAHSAGSALDSAKEPEHDAEAALAATGKRAVQFPMDAWKNVSDRDVRINIGRPILIRPNDTVKIVASLRRAVRKSCGKNEDGTLTLELVHGEEIQHMLKEDEQVGMETAKPKRGGRRQTK